MVSFFLLSLSFFLKGNCFSHSELPTVSRNVHTGDGRRLLHRTVVSSGTVQNTSSSRRVRIDFFSRNLNRSACLFFLPIVCESRLIFRFTHIEGECPFITFDDLLDRLEDLICDVVERVLQSPLGDLVKELNPDFQVPKKPFKRMNYSDAIEYLRENGITKEDGSFYEFGEVREIKFRFLSSRFP